MEWSYFLKFPVNLKKKGKQPLVNHFITPEPTEHNKLDESRADETKQTKSKKMGDKFQHQPQAG